MIASAEEFISLRTSEQPEQYLRSAHDMAEIPVWLDIVHRFPEMRIWVAHNKTVPMAILSILSRDSNPEVRQAVAMKNKLSAELFHLLAIDSDESVRERIALHKNAPAGILADLAADPSVRVASAAIERLKALRFETRHGTRPHQPYS